MSRANSIKKKENNVNNSVENKIQVEDKLSLNSLNMDKGYIEITAESKKESASIEEDQLVNNPFLDPKVAEYYDNLYQSCN